MITASDLVAALYHRSEPASGPQVADPEDRDLRLRMRDLFDVAKAHRELPLTELETVLDNPSEQVRLAAVCVLDFKARAVRTSDERHPLYEVYLRRHERIDTWGMVDRAAPWVVGGYLTGRDLSPLHELASSPLAIERRTSITAPLYFTKYGGDDEVDHSFEIAVRLADDQEAVVYNAVGTFVKHAGRRIPDRQRSFLDRHAAIMARPGLRLAIATLDAETRKHYLGLEP